MATSRTKPCPFCGKKLKRVPKNRWRVNLARHLSNACPAYEREMLLMGTQAIWELLKQLPKLFPLVEQPAKPEEIAELERIHSLEIKPDGATA